MSKSKVHSVTDPANENNEEQQNESADEAVQDSSNADDVAVSQDRDAPPTDELPEDEELTPEIVEEEAIRGDFMLRWAAIFLAVLFGFGQMADTMTLVHIRSGDQLRANGFVPSSQDPLSYALDGRSTANVSWLFDHVVSAVYSLGGENLLTVFKALIAGFIAYLLSRISIRNMPTWWNSVCVVFAAAACSVDFLPVTDLATLLGLSVVLLLLHKHTEGTATGLHWKLPVLMLVWANCDPRAYLGVIAIVLFAAGFSLRKTLAGKAGEPPGAETGVLWKAGGLSLLALLVNPFPVASLMSIVTTYSIEYPTMAAMKSLNDASSLLDGRTEFYSIFTPQVIQGIEFAYVAGFSVLVIALVVMMLGRSREDLPWLLLCLGFGALALWKLHELPAAALVAAAAAGTAAQRWYGRSFRQEYTIDTMEVLFSRGGRALTVLAMAALGFFAVADRLPTRTAIGMGFDPELQETMDSLESQLAQFPDDARFLNTAITQGDLLIWNGRQSFTDSRTGAFGRLSDDDSVMSGFFSLRKNLMARALPAAPGQPETEDDAEDSEWLTEYNELGITQLMLRLAPPGYPAYPMVRRLIVSPEWTEVSRGPSAAIFSHGDLQDGTKAVDLRNLAFRQQAVSSGEDADEDDEAALERFEYAREPGFYRKYLYNKRATASASLRSAEHFLNLDLLPPQAVFEIARATGGDAKKADLMSLLGRALAVPTLAIRGANAALREDPQNAAAYRALGRAYTSLRSIEQAISQALNGEDASKLRYMQAVMAYRQATMIEPMDSSNWRVLIGLYAEQKRIDLALECLDRFLELEEENLLANPDADAEIAQLYDSKSQWESQIGQVVKGLAEFDAQSAPEDMALLSQQKFGTAENLAANGHVRLALERLNKDFELIRRIPQATALRGQLMLEAGQLEEGSQLLNQLAEVAGSQENEQTMKGVKWHTPVAMGHFGKAGYAEGVSAYQAVLELFDRFESKSPDLMRSLVQMLPLVPDSDAVGTGGPLPGWPLNLLERARIPLSAIPAGRNEPRFMTGLAYLEDGNLRAAKEAFTELVKEGGETPYRPLAAIYLIQLSDDAVATLTDSFVSPWEAFVFPGEEQEQKETTEEDA